MQVVFSDVTSPFCKADTRGCIVSSRSNCPFCSPIKSCCGITNIKRGVVANVAIGSAVDSRIMYIFCVFICISANPGWQVNRTCFVRFHHIHGADCITPVTAVCPEVVIPKVVSVQQAPESDFPTIGDNQCGQPPPLGGGGVFFFFFFFFPPGKAPPPKSF